jgi:hypothetical protein
MRHPDYLPNSREIRFLDYQPNLIRVETRSGVRIPIFHLLSDKQWERLTLPSYLTPDKDNDPFEMPQREDVIDLVIYSRDNPKQEDPDVDFRIKLYPFNNVMLSTAWPVLQEDCPFAPFGMDMRLSLSPDGTNQADSTYFVMQAQPSGVARSWGPRIKHPYLGAAQQIEDDIHVSLTVGRDQYIWHPVYADDILNNEFGDPVHLLVWDQDNIYARRAGEESPRSDKFFFPHDAQLLKDIDLSITVNKST